MATPEKKKVQRLPTDKISANRPAVVEKLNSKTAEIYEAKETSMPKLLRSKDFKLALWCNSMTEARKRAKELNQRVASGRPKVSKTPGNPESGAEYPLPKPEGPGAKIIQNSDAKKEKVKASKEKEVVLGGFQRQSAPAPEAPKAEIKAAEAPGMEEVDESRTGHTEEFPERAKKALAAELGVDPSEIEENEGLKENTPGASTDDVAGFTHGGEDYLVFASDGDVDRVATAVVEEMLTEEPELFNQDFIMHYMDASDLDKRLYAQDIANGRAEDLRGSELTREVERLGLEVSDDEDAMRQAVEEAYQEEIEAEIKKQGFAEYLVNEGLYDDVAAVIEAGIIRLWGDDTRRAAEDAIASDGAGHFLSSYDGAVHDLSDGMQYVIK